MFPLIRTLCLACALGLATSILWPASMRADTVILNDGTEIEGRLIEETDAYVRLEYQVSKTIKDIKIIQRTDIKQITKETPDSLLYAKMKEAMPPGDRLNVSDYEELLTMYPRRFATEFPSSPLLPLVREIETQLEEEKAKVSAGSVKLDGKWVTPEEIAADPYNHQARLLAADIQALLKEGKTTEALHQFEILEAEYPYSTAIATLYAPVLKTLGTYEATIKRAIAENPPKLAAREKELASLDPQGRTVAEEAFKRDMETFHKEWEAAKALKQKWLPTNTWDKKSLDEAAKVIASEKTRIEKIDTAARGKAAALLATAFSALSGGRIEAADLQIKKASEAGVDSKTVADFRAKLATAKAAADATAALEAAKNTPPPKVEEPAATEPPMKEEPKEPTPVAADPPAEAEKTEKPKADPPAPKKEVADSPMKGTSRDLSGLIDPEETTEPEKKAEPAISFQTILFILIGAMIVITVLAKVFSKPAPEDFEEAVSEDDEDEDASENQER